MKNKLKLILEDMFQEFYENWYIEIEGTDAVVKDKEWNLVDMAQVKVEFMEYIDEFILNNI